MLRLTVCRLREFASYQDGVTPISPSCSAISISRFCVDGVISHGAFMEFELTEDQQQVRSSVREFAEGEIAPHVMEVGRGSAFFP